MASAPSFAALGAAQELKHARDATAAALKRRVAALIASGALPPTAAAVAATALDAVPTTRVTTRPAVETPYRHARNALPVPRSATTDALLLGTRVSLGRARWTHDGGSGASIFSVADGRKLASEPARHATAWEAARAARVARASIETPLLAGVRVMPVYSPGRALLWGTVLAAWGTGAIVASTARSLEIREAGDVGRVLTPRLAPLAAAVASIVEPWRGSLSVASSSTAGDGARELGRRVKARLAGA